MSAVAAMASHLKADTAVAALVSAKVFRVLAPRTVDLPYVVLQNIGDEPVRHMGGGSGVGTVRVECTGWAKTRSVARAIAAAIKGAMDNYRGTLGTGSNAITAQACFLGPSTDAYEPATADTDKGYFGVRQPWIIWYKE